ncbi:hypothetical protein [Oryza sativa Japonica Group]|uniref:Uncharacterized protein n=2 Tax=Oryza sativa subsp. japonica TaxID=39947 RepID=Q5VNZ3_ORYSJ|nr:hypothetical protein [Oryza sativa Japonica Group]BAD69078.1 hypothetical protein [Oryza sativa Japonica Group]
MSPMSSGDLFCNQRPRLLLRNATPGATPKRNRYGSASTQHHNLVRPLQLTYQWAAFVEP